MPRYCELCAHGLSHLALHTFRDLRLQHIPIRCSLCSTKCVHEYEVANEQLHIYARSDATNSPYEGMRMSKFCAFKNEECVIIANRRNMPKRAACQELRAYQRARWLPTP
jgi:hypothetical protein